MPATSAQLPVDSAYRVHRRAHRSDPALLPRGKLPFFDELAAEFDTQWVIHVEHVDGDTTNGRAPHDVGAIQTEMVSPLVPAGMKKRCQPSSVRVQSSQIWPLALITPQAGASKIAQDRAAPVLPGNGMLNFEGDRLYKEFPGVVLLRK